MSYLAAIETDADERLRIKRELLAVTAERDRLNAVVVSLLNHCPDPECMTCGEIACPHGEPLHFHHDGCPACAELGEEGN